MKTKNLRAGFAAQILFATGLVVTGLVMGTHAAKADGHGTHGATDYAVKSDMADKALLLDVVELGSRLIAVGEFGHVLISDNGGDSWTQAASVPTRNTLTSVFFIDNQTGFAVGHEATILKTVDGGNNWTQQYNEARGETPLMGIFFTDAQNGIAVGGFSYYFTTADGGETWAQRPLIEDSYDDFHLNDLFADTKGNLFIPAEFGTVYKSVDRGANWQTITTPYDGSFWGGFGLANGDVLIFGMRGNIYKSADAGKSWTKADSKADQSITGGLQLPDGRIVLTGLSGVVLVSTDNGASFTGGTRPDRLSFATVARGKDDTVLLLGDPGVKSHVLK